MPNEPAAKKQSVASAQRANTQSSGGQVAMQLKTKFTTFIGLVICCSVGVTFYRASSYQEDLVVKMATRQAEMLFHQIRLTRQWIADHNGLFLIKAPGVEENPFLSNATIQDKEGNWLVKRNPAMVTRELSAYAAREGLGYFNVTSLKLLNPNNAPDAFEQQSLKAFETGLNEIVAVEKVDGKYRLRYMAPLKVGKRCLGCHHDQGYSVDDIRGGMNVTIPMDWAFAEIRTNNRMVLNIGIATIVIVILMIFVMFDRLVIKRLKELEGEMDQYPKYNNTSNLNQVENHDEIGTLAHHFRKLCQRIDQSQQELDAGREQVCQSEKMAALGRLIAGVSHEINNPLGGMQNCIQTLHKQPNNSETISRYLDLLNQGVGRIRNTVQQLLKIGRKEPMVQRLGNVDPMIRECLELSCMGRSDIQTQALLDVQKPILVSMECLRQVIVNLTGNAVQAMDDRGGSLIVTSRVDRESLIIEVEDTGPGIEPQHMNKIFEPFFTTKDVGDGTGLGLSISYSLVERMGGELTAGNRSDGGAIFVVVIPLNNELTTPGDIS